VDLSGWPTFERLVEAAYSLPFLQVWMFGSALWLDNPADLDVLLV